MVLGSQALKVHHVTVNEAECKEVVSATVSLWIGLVKEKLNKKDDTVPNSPFSFSLLQACQAPLPPSSPLPPSFIGRPLLPFAFLLYPFGLYFVAAFSSVSFSLPFWVVSEEGAV